MRRSRLALLVVVGLAAAGCGSGTGPDRLAAGDCFDVPAAGDRIGEVARRSCTELHDGEAFHAFDATGDSAAYPTDPQWEQLVYPVCDPVFETYTGTFVADRLDIEYRYLVPTADRWAAGDRRVTCFIRAPDGSKLDRSHRGGASVPAES